MTTILPPPIREPNHDVATKAPAAGAPNLQQPMEGAHASPFPAAAPNSPEPSGLGPILADPLLKMCADIVDDLERVRCANENRLRALTTPPNQADADGECRGHGLTLDHPDVLRLSMLVDSLKDAEHKAVLNLSRAMRRHPLGGWVKGQVGVGEKQAARLLATIRDPYWNDPHNRPRTLRELWAYCGFHVLDASAPTRRRGEKANWNAEARKRTWLIAASCLKQADSPYRKVYDETRAHYADAVHQSPCVRCGPSGKPAQPGSPLSLGHQHGRGMRAMGKQILCDIWTEAKRLHTNATPPETP